jgi:hypothetical protein
MCNNPIVSKADNRHGVVRCARPGRTRTAPGERTIAVDVIAASEEKMRKRDVVSTHGVPGYGTFEVQCDEGTPLGGGDSAPPPLAYLAVGVAFCALTHVTEYTQATKMRVDDARIELQLGFATSVTPRSMPSVPHERIAREIGGSCGGMESGSSMVTRAEVTHEYAKAYAAASKKDRGRMLDVAVSVTVWSRDNARRRLVAAARTPPGPGPGAGHSGTQATAWPRMTDLLCKRVVRLKGT